MIKIVDDNYCFFFVYAFASVRIDHKEIAANPEV